MFGGRDKGSRISIMRKIKNSISVLKTQFWNYKKREYTAEIWNGIELIFVSATITVIFDYDNQREIGTTWQIQPG